MVILTSFHEIANNHDSLQTCPTGRLQRAFRQHRPIARHYKPRHRRSQSRRTTSPACSESGRCHGNDGGVRIPLHRCSTVCQAFGGRRSNRRPAKDSVLSPPPYEIVNAALQAEHRIHDVFDHAVEGQAFQDRIEVARRTGQEVGPAVRILFHEFAGQERVLAHHVLRLERARGQNDGRFPQALRLVGVLLQLSHLGQPLDLADHHVLFRLAAIEGEHHAAVDAGTFLHAVAHHRIDADAFIAEGRRDAGQRSGPVHNVSAKNPMAAGGFTHAAISSSVRRRVMLCFPPAR